MSTDISLAELVHSNELWKSSGDIRIGQQLKSDRARGGALHPAAESSQGHAGACLGVFTSTRVPTRVIARRPHAVSNVARKGLKMRREEVKLEAA